MSADLTICIPIGPGHEELAERAFESVKRQTLSVNGDSYYDAAGHGAGFARNRLLEGVQTPFVAFLDADDWLEPEFSGMMLGAAQAAGDRYVYCGWWADALAVHAPPRCYCPDAQANDVHPITAVVRTEWARGVNGFDETLPGMEDTDFFLKLRAAGYCGLAFDQPYLHWTANGARSTAFRQRTDYRDIRDLLFRKYYIGGEMPCCGGPGKIQEAPAGDKQPTDVIAFVDGTPQFVYVGRSTGRIYRLPGYGARMWIDSRDLALDPKFRRAPAILPNTVSSNPAYVPPVAHSAADVAQAVQGAQTDGANVYLPQAETPVVPTQKVTVAMLRKLAGK